MLFSIHPLAAEDDRPRPDMPGAGAGSRMILHGTGDGMIRGLGLDVTEIARIEHIWRRYGSRFASRILHPRELAVLPESPVLFLAGRFAVKEAAAKALGTGFAAGVTPLDMETGRTDSGAPILHLHGAAARRMAALGANRIHVSITHSRGSAAAVVVLEG